MHKTKQEALYIIEQYIKMIHEQPYDDAVLGEALVFKNTYKQAARIKCATLGWVGVQQLISKED
jgi:nitrogen fixation NifU-like protein